MNHPKSVRLLLADNSAEYRRSVRGFLELEGYVVEEVGGPQRALELLGTKTFDLVLVDLRLQDDDNTNDMTGLEIAKFASERGTACILVTAFPSFELARAALRSRGLESYAKDMIMKGSDPQTILDSISLTLSYVGSSSGVSNGNQLDSKALCLDQTQRMVLKYGKPINLSKNQYTLMEKLFEEPGRVFSSTELFLAIYGEKVDERSALHDRRLRNLVDRTNAKLKDKDSDHQYIEAVSGRGYRLNLRK